ncbi:MAG TPA: EAL domain-containing protein [Acidocella sp.]|uniref:EAL domain-containing protein n=1 Tax=Acidocella sp. TaxID=50710 RepID=UPI002B7F511F|nr:EAL domain-containing protein [Acidocella sp.]HVE22712.1 EAL domain-containing protein [Acidocella sp.]
MTAISTTTLSSDTMYRMLVQSVTDYAIYMLDPEGHVVNWNAGAQRSKGYRAEEIVGRHFSCFFVPEDSAQQLPQRSLAEALATQKFEDEGWRLRRDGSRYWAHVVIQPIHDESGTLVGFAHITQDRSAQKQQGDQLRALAQNLNLALANMSQGLSLFDANETLVLSNARLHEILGIDPAALQPGAALSDILWIVHADPAVPREQIAETVRRSREAIVAGMAEAGGIVTRELPWRGRVLQVSHRALRGGGFVSTVDDVTERRAIEDRITHLAHHDTLTALPNRMTFRARLESALKGVDEFSPCAVLYVDLDRFKPVNDTLGHQIGDLVLQAAADRIRAQLGESDVVARLGGDEFAVLIARCHEMQDVTALAERLIRDISSPITIKGLQVLIGASIGIAYAPQHGLDPDLLLRNADLALYRAKSVGRGCHHAYEPGMEKVVQERRDLERDLRAALTGEQFTLHYQPIVDTGRHEITGFEALLRWQSPTRGRVSPADFIPFAEEIGFMPELGRWVLETACAEAASWPHELKVSVNLSPKQFRQADLLGHIAATLEKTGLPARRLELEITETAMIDDLQSATEILAKLRKLGIQIAMDDFGTGYSSLSFLRTLPFTRIKIDRSFVQDVESKPEALAIIRAVSLLCGSLGVSATAEGVETERQAEILRAEGCPELQGFLIARPCPASELPGWIEAYRRNHGAAVPQPA